MDNNKENFQKCWEEFLKDWDGSTKHTFNANKWETNTNIPRSGQTTANLDLETNNTIIEESGNKQDSFSISDSNNNREITPEEANPTTLSLKIQNEIARGGMGVIHKGYQNNLEREVAIKKTISNSDFIRNKFIAESKITAFLDHPNIVPIHDLGIDENQELVLVMKLIQGTSWKESIKQNTEEKNLQILLTVMNAVAFAHSKGIVHNDLKPENVMIGSFGEIFLMDWGIAVDIRNKENSNINFPHKSTICSPLGTPGYMSPELAEGKGNEINVTSDVYLLGSILYEILMKTHPHKGKNFPEILASILQYKPLEWHDHIPNKLKEICTKAMSVKPEERYQNITDFQADIENYLQHKESIMITENAYKELKKCQKNQDKQNRRLYDDLAEMIYSFKQALKLWEQNNLAEQGKIEAIEEYIKTAIQNCDLELAQSLLEKLPSNHPEQSTLQNEIHKAKETLDCKKISQKMLKVIKFMMFIIAFAILALLFMPTPKQQTYFSQPNAKSFIVFSLMLVVCVISRKFFSYNRKNLRHIFAFSIFFELAMITLISILVVSVEYHPEAVTTGVCPTASFILIFRLVLPYPFKVSLIAGIISASSAAISILIAQNFFGYQYPRMIIEPFILEGYLVAIAATFLSNRKN